MIENLHHAKISHEKDTYMFTVQSDLGSEVTYTIFSDNENLDFIITSTISVPENAERSYSQIVQRIEYSIVFVSE